MKIATLIPAYKTKYMVDLFSSLRNQTIPSTRIIISDDSPNGEFRQALESDSIRPLLDGLDISVHEGPRTGAYENLKHLIGLWNGETELVHIMLDDDVAYPEFYERHLTAHLSAEISCSISRRWGANEAGLPCKGQPVPAAVARNNDRILLLNSDVVFMTTVAESTNWFGEFSNAVFRADTCSILLEPLLADVSYAGLWDLGAFVAASLKAPIGYIQDHLGYFRSGGENHSSTPFGPHMKAAFLGYAALAIGGQRIGKLTLEQGLKCFRLLADFLQRYYSDQDDMRIFCELLPRMAQGEGSANIEFLDAWSAFQKRHGF